MAQQSVALPAVATAPGLEAQGRYERASLAMLAVIMAALTAIFLVGVGILAASTDFQSADIVAIISPALTAVGTVAAGVFGYSIGSKGATEAHESAVVARHRADAMERDVVPLVREVEMIVRRAKDGEESAPGKRHVSEDDLRTLLATSAPLTRQFGTGIEPR